MSNVRTSGALEVENLCKSYVSGGKRVFPLVDVQFTLAPGNFAAIVGPSGSGKSTLLNLIAGLDTPDSGSIKLDGVDLTSLGPEEIAETRLLHLGIVFQFFNLLPTLSIEQNISVPGHLAGLKRIEREERANSLLNALGIAGLAKRYPHEVSGGEVQRAAVARALFNKPALILADEPTGNLDPDTASIVIELFESLVREEGASLIIVTHDTEISARAQHVLRLDSGKLVT